MTSPTIAFRLCVPILAMLGLTGCVAALPLAQMAMTSPPAPTGCAATNAAQPCDDSMAGSLVRGLGQSAQRLAGTAIPGR